MLSMKTGFAEAQAKEWLGEVQLVDLGIPRGLGKVVLGTDCRPCSTGISSK
jgi:hypothetical protein